MDACQSTDILSLTTTVGSQADARRLAQALVARRLAACVQVDGPLESHYRWKGQACADPEWRLTAKTLPARLGDLQAYFAAEHPYEVPQLLWQVLAASPGYAAWVQAETAVDA